MDGCAPDAPAAGGKVYQLWQIRPSVGPESIGLALAPGQTAALRIVEGLPSADQVSVTIEPPNRSTVPTLPTKGDVKLA